MALSTRKKNTIIADWKTGKFKSYSSIAKHYKIDFKTAKKILIDITHENAQIVEVCTVAESAKKSVKNPIELKAVEKAVLERLKVDEISNLLLDSMKDHIVNGKATKVVTTGSGEGTSVAEIVEYDLQADDYKKLADAVDKVSVTTGVNERFANSQVNIQNNNQNTQQTLEQTGITIKFGDDE